MIFYKITITMESLAFTWAEPTNMEDAFLLVLDICEDFL